MSIHVYYSTCMLRAARPVSSAPRFTERLQNQSVNEGQPVHFTAEAVGVPQPMLGWSKDGRILPVAGEHYRIETDGGRSSLHIAAARPDDNAWFQCTAASVVGTAVNRARLIVHGMRSSLRRYYLRQRGNVFARLRLFVCVSVC